ncbi:hypothetical protein [Bacillus sp. FJAT-45350]|uniref:hypothetical protein n=1 Tax=Bacillus sp. FJAT-45350 TaxID=2011014 RepID=UPI000BB8B5B1|nr:hypothetical protein [Bacillus sp. FJAT-45350]
MNFEFLYNDRLGISIPVLHNEWDDIETDTQAKIIFQWEQIRGQIPERISNIETIINRKQEQLYNEDNFQRSCELNREIAEHASIINDLWIWYRKSEEVTAKVHQ